MQELFLVIEEVDGERVAHVTVTGVVTDSVVVQFTLDGKAKGPVLVPTPGRGKTPGPRTAVAEKKLGKLKPGSHTVTTNVAGDTASDSLTFEVEESQRKTSGMEWVWSGLFLFLTLLFGYREMICVGLAATLVILAVVALRKGTDGFGKCYLRRLQNNDWIFYFYLSLFLISFAFWASGFSSGTPVTEFNPFNWAGGKVVEAVIRPATNPYSNDGLGSWFRRLLLGNEGGWGGATIFFLVSLPFSWLTSFQDNLRESWKSKKSGTPIVGAHGFWGGFVLDTIYDIIQGVIRLPWKGGKK